MPHSIRTKRLLMRPVICRDAVAFWRALNTPDYTSTTGTWSYPFTPETVLRRIRTKTDDFYWFTLMYGSEFAGSALLFGPGDDDIEVGYAVAGAFGGRGLATEAARASCAFAFGALRRKSIRARVSVDNIASIKILDRLGFSREGGKQMGWSEHFGKNTPLYNYRMTREGFKL